MYRMQWYQECGCDESLAGSAGGCWLPEGGAVAVLATLACSFWQKQIKNISLLFDFLFPVEFVVVS